MSDTARRFALYLAPTPESALWRFGSAVLGHDAETGEAPAVPDLPGFDAETWHALTEEPRRYGFHGTLKAPFRLRDGIGDADFSTALAAFAAGRHAFEMPPLEVTALGPFIALTPAARVPQLNDLAAAAVTELDGLRAPLTADEVARRRPDRLSARQAEHLAAYGYPYVLDEFRFHMTLTGPLPERDRIHALNALRDAYAASGAAVPVPVGEVALYEQAVPGERFRLSRRLPFGGRS